MFRVLQLNIEVDAVTSSTFYLEGNSCENFTLTIQLIKPNYFVILPHRHSTTVSLKTYPLYTSDKVPLALENLNDLTLKWMK